jgi:hypothetical protein
MPRLRPLLAGLVLALVGCLGAGAAGAAPSAAEQALAAGAFTDSVGVSLHPADAASGFALAERLDAAGIHHVRGPAATGPDDPALPGLRALAGAGLQLDLVAGAGADPAAVADTAATLGAAVGSLEAPDGESASGLRRAVRADPRLPGVAVLGSGPGADYQTARIDLAGHCPGCVPDQLGAGDGAVQVTEVALGAGVPGPVAARYLPRLLLANAGRAVRTFLDGDGAPDGAGPGLLDAGSPTPAYAAVASLLALLQDDPGRAAPGRLGFRLTGTVDHLHHLLLQKTDGHFWLALWVERPGWDPASGQALAVPDQPVRVALEEPVAGARLFVPERGTAAERSFTDPPGPGRLDAVDLEVGDRVVLLELLPAGQAGSAPGATTPPTVSPQATAPTRPPVVKAAGQPSPATTRPAGDGPRAVAARPAAALDPASRSPLAFTGSTALSMLGASMLLLLVGVAALFASRRRYHHRH